MQDLSGKCAFVTGAASGIGLGIARAALDAGMSVMLADIESGALDAAWTALEELGDVDRVVVDVSQRESVQAAALATFERFGNVHLVCNNAGVSTGGLIEDCTPADWDWIIGVNYRGVIHGCEAFIPHIRAHGQGGHIVNTASMAGLLGGRAGWTPYNSTKFAVVGLIEALRQEGRLHADRQGSFGASVLCPGGVRTNIYHAPRNRPARFGAQQSDVAPETSAEDFIHALDPDVVGRLVLEAVRANRLYIFTDPRFSGQVQRRFERIASDFAWAADSEALNAAGAPGASGVPAT